MEKKWGLEKSKNLPQIMQLIKGYQRDAHL